jgi:uncharacterized protein DUF4328
MLNLTDVAQSEPPPAPRPMLARSIATVILLSAELSLALFLCVLHWQRLTLLRLIGTHHQVERSVLAANDAFIRGLSLVSVTFVIVTAVAFLLWLHRANANLRAFRSEPIEFTPGEAAGSFFIPVVNLVRPYHVMREVWQGSDPKLPPMSSTSFRESRSSSLVLAWWLLFVGRNVPAWWMFTASRMSGPRLDVLISTTYGALAMYLLTIPAACMAMALVFLIDRRQEALVVALGRAQAPQDAQAG